MDDDEVEPIEDTRVDAFEPGTRITLMSDGSLRLRVSSMPPSWATQPFDSFQSDLAHALGAAVTGLDKELFEVRAPPPDAVDRIVKFLDALRKRG